MFDKVNSEEEDKKSPCERKLKSKSSKGNIEESIQGREVWEKSKEFFWKQDNILCKIKVKEIRSKFLRTSCTTTK